MTAQPVDISMFSGEVHPYAAAFPMLSAAELDALTDSIRRNGQLHPILLTPDGVLIDGRNRLAACGRARIEPRFEVTDADPYDVILAANVDRRHMAATQRMAARAKAAHAKGLRIIGSDGKPRWKRGSLGANTESVLAQTDKDAFRLLGKVVDHDPALLDQIIAGRPLESVLTDIEKANAEADARDQAEAEARERWALLTEHGYAERIADGSLTEAEALTLLEDSRKEEQKRAEEHKDAIRRKVSWLNSFLTGYRMAAGMATSPSRDEVLAELDPFDRDRFLTIEKAITWPSTLI